MFKYILAMIFGFTFGLEAYHRHSEKLLENQARSHDNEMSKQFSETFHIGWESCENQAKQYHKIYHKECDGIFCMK